MQQMCDAMNNITDLDNESLFSAFSEYYSLY